MLDARSLWTAVLTQAVIDLTNANNRRFERRALQHFARLWFESDNHEPGSFLWICDYLELDPSRLRRRLLAIAGRLTGRPSRLPPFNQTADMKPCDIAAAL